MKITYDNVTLRDYQLSDVEEEINGLITYDRENVKIPREFMKELNEELYNEAEKIK